MPDFTVRSDAVNVEQIMEQIRARIREKRGVDYTEQQIRELAAVKLEKFLDPKSVRSDLLQQFQKIQAERTAGASNVTFGPNAIFEAQRPIIARIRRWLHPVLRLFFNPDPISQALVRLNDLDPRADMYYELFHNLVIELTRTSIEVRNLKMRVESLTGRLEFNERRARALESVVVYKPSDDGPTIQSPQNVARNSGGHTPSPGHTASAGPAAAVRPLPAPETQAGSSVAAAATPGGLPPSEGPGQRSRRRRRRRGRRGTGSAVALMGGASGGGPAAPSESSQASAEAIADEPDSVDDPNDSSDGDPSGGPESDSGQ